MLLEKKYTDGFYFGVDRFISEKGINCNYSKATENKRDKKKWTSAVWPHPSCSSQVVATDHEIFQPLFLTAAVLGKNNNAKNI